MWSFVTAAAIVLAFMVSSVEHNPGGGGGDTESFGGMFDQFSKCCPQFRTKHSLFNIDPFATWLALKAKPIIKNTS